MTHCVANEWGNDRIHLVKPSSSSSEECIVGVSATVIPALIATTETTGFGVDAAQSESSSNREEHGTFSTLLTGTLSADVYECQQNFNARDDDLYGLLEGDFNKYENENFHPVNACECILNEPRDFLDIDGSGRATHFCETGCIDGIINELDPDVDVENRINAQIHKTIGDILSTILKDSISTALSDAISLEDSDFIPKRTLSK